MANGQQIDFTFGNIKFINHTIVTDAKTVALAPRHSIVRIVLKTQTNFVNF